MGSITFIAGIVKEKNLLKHTSQFFLIFFEVYKDVSYMRMKGKFDRLMNSDIGGNKVLSECEQGLMKHNIC